MSDSLSSDHQTNFDELSTDEICCWKQERCRKCVLKLKRSNLNKCVTELQSRGGQFKAAKRILINRVLDIFLGDRIKTFFLPLFVSVAPACCRGQTVNWGRDPESLNLLTCSVRWTVCDAAGCQENIPPL